MIQRLRCVWNGMERQVSFTEFAPNAFHCFIFCETCFRNFGSEISSLVSCLFRRNARALLCFLWDVNNEPSVLSTVLQVQMSMWRPQWGFIPQQFTITLTGHLDNDIFESTIFFAVNVDRLRRLIFAAPVQSAKMF